MNKKILLAGIFLAAGYLTFTAFKTAEQQKQEIAAAITARLDEFRAQKEEECTIRVNEEGQRRFQEYLASKPATANKTTKKLKPKNVNPLPQTAPGTNPKKDKMEGAPNTPEKQDKMQSVPNTDKKKSKMQGGGGQ